MPLSMHGQYSVQDENGTPVYGWRADRFRGAWKLINKWKKRYPNEPEKVRFLVENALLDTNSPGRREAFQAYLKETEHV